MIHLPLVFGLALVLSLVMTPLVIRVLLRSKIMDIPNLRSSHSVPVPRGGGFGILIPFVLIIGVMLLVGALRFDAIMLAIMVGLAGMTLIGFLDDIFSLSALIRLALEGLLMGVCLALAPLQLREIAFPLSPPIATGIAGWVLAWLFLVGFPNLFNFMDGINGLAGSQTLIACVTLTILGHLSGQTNLAVFTAVIAGGSLGFLRYNVPQARVFMGDSGSLPIGFLLAATALALSGRGAGIPIIVPVLVLWAFLFDAGLTLVIRACRKRRLHHAHRHHLYQRLVAMGYSHARVTVMYSLMMISLAAVALVYQHAGESLRLLLLIVVIATSFGLAALVLYAYRRRVVQCVTRPQRDD